VNTAGPQTSIVYINDMTILLITFLIILILISNARRFQAAGGIAGVEETIIGQVGHAVIQFGDNQLMLWD
jgi:energy-coupling factor transporter transmembrane protein EcfT